MAAEKVISIEDIEDAEYDGKEYKRVMDTDGLYYNLKQGREGRLRAKWGLLKKGATIKLIFGEFKGKKFVQDIESISDEVAKQAIHKHGIEEDNRLQSIESQVAYKEIGLNLRAGNYDPDKLKLYPEINSHAHLQAYDSWIQSRTLPFGEGEILPPTPNAGEQRRQEEATQAASTSGEYPRTPESLQTVGGLMNALMEDTHDPKLRIPTVEKVLKKQLGEVDDIPQAYRDFLDWHYRYAEKKEGKHEPETS